jgi:hypothetical protein
MLIGWERFARTFFFHPKGRNAYTPYFEIIGSSETRTSAFGIVACFNAESIKKAVQSEKKKHLFKRF